MKKAFATLMTFAALLPACAQTNIAVDMTKVEARIPTLIYGAGAEDVNHEIYGGLYDQRIFGESFEEAAPSLVENFSSYDSPWGLEGDMLKVYANSHGKIVYEGKTLSNASVTADIRIEGDRAITGFIINVSGAGNGADNFRGYEISLDAGDRTLVIGKHENNWQPIAEIPVDFVPTEWNNLRVDFDGAKASVWLNNSKVYELDDKSNPLTDGFVGLRSFDGSAVFRNFKIDNEIVPMTARAEGVVGFRHYDNPWTVEGTMLRTSGGLTAKIVSLGEEMGIGTAEVEVRLDGPRSISGFIFNVDEAGQGPDNFRGYEISLDADDRALVVGKHEHDWQEIAKVPVDFVPTEWNNLHVDYEGGKFTVNLNGKEVYNHDDKNNPLQGGKVGLRTYDGAVSFRNLKIHGKEIALSSMPVGVSGMWTPVGDGVFTHDGIDAFNGTYSQKITGEPGVGVGNHSLNKWGINVVEGKEMQGYVYLKGNIAKAVVALQSADGSKEYCRQKLTGVTGKWQRFDFKLTPSMSDKEARFVIALDDKGTMWVDMAMLHTDSYPFRSDLTEAFKQERLTFLRYGGTMINAPEYKVKNMMGERDLRPPYIGHWYRNSTNGFGILEFVEFARMIGTEPTFSINIEDDPQDVLKLLEELEKHNLKYIEIGNEENIGDESLAAYKHYVERFMAFYNIIHPVYPDLQFINAAWWRSDKPEIMEYVFRSLDGKSTLWDYHPWTDEVAQARAVETELKNMRTLFYKWNPQTTMKCAILEENGNTHSMHRALSHAIVLNVVRKMDGFVQLDSPANALQPYLQNDNGWDQGQIFFNSSSVWCQPPYYAQQMAATHHQPILVKSTCRNRNINITATKNEKGDILVLHMINTSSSQLPVNIDIIGMEGVKNMKAVTLSGELADTNTPQAPHKIVPQELELQDTQFTLEPRSYTVVEITGDKTLGIGDVLTNSQEENTYYYNMSGQRVTTPGHGIFINNRGEKVAL